ncbi:hypothetical protein H4CHR_05665 [Variovorax sp. PBS-H4]|uniref:DUF3618 domain-containing protein n=1 Tax=Variovorax sp. PBS-H4 TaxID=434008 RepID=UPI00131807D4|nr:DUF3618 domain-containing protein [Variovorax sp. PBS-H4]VTU40932.1 hypothetical protein H4CHR_05665 [Variovorax sp. PBS-H4]
MNHGDRTSEQIQADIQHTRADLDRTLTLLERRLEPRRLLDQGVDYLRDNGAREYLSNLGRAAKEQPLPLALVGVGLAWMMMTNGRSGSSVTDGRALGDAIGSAAEEARSRAAEGVDGLRSRAGELSGKVGDAASQLASQTRDAAQRTSQGLSQAADAARARAAQVSEATRQGAQKVRSGYDHLVNEQPLALGAIGLALGAVLAAAAPRTRQEDEWMGGTSDKLVDDATRAGKEKLDQVQSAVSEAAGRTTEPVGAYDRGEWDTEADRSAQDPGARQRQDWIQSQKQASVSSYGEGTGPITPSPATAGTGDTQPI